MTQYYTPIRIAKEKKKNMMKPHAGTDTEQLELSYKPSEKANDNHLGEQFDRFL